MINIDSAHLRDRQSDISFKISAADISQIRKPRLPRHFLWEFLLDGRTPARAMTDAAMREILPAMSGDGIIIELGAGGDYYKKYMSPEQKYLTSNLTSGCDLQLDMTRLKLEDNSVDALISVFALEHLYDYESVFKEMQRVLKPGGRMAIIAPFMYYYHAAPDDFFRFTESAMNRLLSSMTILRCQPLGSKALPIAELLHEKTIMGSKLGSFSRLLFRLIAIPFLAMGLRSHDSRYAIGFAYLAEKTQ